MNNYDSHIHQHLGFIRRSCSAFDNGALDESLRIAVSLRVLFHDTKSSHSLMHQLGVKRQIELLTTFTPAYIEDPKTGLTQATVPLWLNLSDGIREVPLGNTKRKDYLPFQEWWDEIVMFDNAKFSRKDIILCAANQDGGAHVDENPSKKTTELKQGVGPFAVFQNRELVEGELINHHFFLIRQFAYEVLESHDIHNMGLTGGISED